MKKLLLKNKILLLMLLPALIYVIVFSYLPMAGIVLAFKNYRYADGIFGSPWVGLDNFKFLFVSNKIWQLTRNTLLYNGMDSMLPDYDPFESLKRYALKDYGPNGVLMFICIVFYIRTGVIDD